MPVAIVGAILYHLLLVLMALYLPAGGGGLREAPRILLDTRRATPLVEPIMPPELTQKTPNQSKPSHEVDLASLLPRPAVKESVSARPAPAIPASPKPSASLIEAPKVETARADVTQMSAPVAPQIQAPPPPKTEPPKLAFESVRSANAATVAGAPKLDLPRGTVEEAARGAMKEGGRGLTVGDYETAPGGVGDVLGRSAVPGRTGAQMELLSDPQGVDFRPYLTQVLASVRRHWKDVIPESARLGMRGRVALQFAIGRDGQVLKLVIAAPSGTRSFDLAAVAGVSASVPLPPLPADFKGDQIRLQMNFSYNMPAQ
jgi:TonB family protein